MTLAWTRARGAWQAAPVWLRVALAVLALAVVAWLAYRVGVAVLGGVGTLIGWVVARRSPRGRARRAPPVEMARDLAADAGAALEDRRRDLAAADAAIDAGLTALAAREAVAVRDAAPPADHLTPLVSEELRR